MGGWVDGWRDGGGTLASNGDSTQIKHKRARSPAITCTKAQNAHNTHLLTRVQLQKRAGEGDIDPQAEHTNIN